MNPVVVEQAKRLGVDPVGLLNFYRGLGPMPAPLPPKEVVEARQRALRAKRRREEKAHAAAEAAALDEIGVDDGQLAEPS